MLNRDLGQVKPCDITRTSRVAWGVVALSAGLGEPVEVVLSLWLWRWARVRGVLGGDAGYGSLLVWDRLVQRGGSRGWAQSGRSWRAAV